MQVKPLTQLSIDDLFKDGVTVMTKLRTQGEWHPYRAYLVLSLQELIDKLAKEFPGNGVLLISINGIMILTQFKQGEFSIIEEPIQFYLNEVEEHQKILVGG